MENIIVRPTPQHALLDVGELWRYRYLFLVLVWRTLKVRCQQTVVGVAWAVLQPLMLTIVFTLIFGLLARMPTDGQPYPIFVLAGLLVWQFVAQSFLHASASVVAEAHLITRIYFPRILLLLAAIGAALFDLVCVFALLLCFMLWYGIAPGIGVLAFIPALLLVAATSFGLSLWLAALYVPYRDVGHLLPFMTQVWMFLSPVIYPVSLLPPEYEFLYAMNPVMVAVQTSRWAFAGGEPPGAYLAAISTAVAALLVLSGLWFFRRREGTFADKV
ncbi:MAG: ABC transporter permease [Candidatus Parcubacteria bacterium]|nr:ABC transporter permease [Burkholderiales bacterium]